MLNTGSEAGSVVIASPPRPMTRRRSRPSARSVSTRWSWKALTASSRTSSRCGSTSVQWSRPGVATGATTSLKFRAPSPLVMMRKRSPCSSSTWCSTLYSCSCSRGDESRFSVGLVSGNEPGLRRELRGRLDEHETTGPRATDVDEETLVVFAEHERVVRRRSLQPVAPHLVGSHGVVGSYVEARCGVIRPREAVRHVLDDVVEIGAGLEIAEVERVALAAGDVGRVSEHPVVGRDLETAQRKVVVAVRRVRSRRGGPARPRRQDPQRATDGNGSGTAGLRRCVSSSSRTRRVRAPTGRSPAPGCGSRRRCGRGDRPPTPARSRRRRSRPRGRRARPGRHGSGASTSRRRARRRGSRASGGAEARTAASAGPSRRA